MFEILGKQNVKNIQCRMITTVNVKVNICPTKGSTILYTGATNTIACTLYACMNKIAKRVARIRVLLHILPSYKPTSMCVLFFCYVFCFIKNILCNNGRFAVLMFQLVFISVIILFFCMQLCVLFVCIHLKSLPALLCYIICQKRKY